MASGPAGMVGPAKAEAAKAQAALVKIASTDYRGNRSEESQVAHAALAETIAEDAAPWNSSTAAPMTPDEEWKGFKAACIEAFKAIKASNASNAAKVQVLSATPEPAAANPLALPLEMNLKIVP